MSRMGVADKYKRLLLSFLAKLCVCQKICWRSHSERKEENGFRADMEPTRADMEPMKAVNGQERSSSQKNMEESHMLKGSSSECRLEQGTFNLQTTTEGPQTVQRIWGIIPREEAVEGQGTSSSKRNMKESQRLKESSSEWNIGQQTCISQTNMKQLQTVQQRSCEAETEECGTEPDIEEEEEEEEERVRPPILKDAFYDVFICHRGKDTKNSIVDVLRGMLNDKGITCFVDYQIPKGTKFAPHISRVIRNARVHIIVLSPNFIKSRWCLLEAKEIMDTQRRLNHIRRQIVLPVFVDVKTFHVRHQPEETPFDFGILKRFTAEEKAAWRKTLTEISMITGFEWDSKKTFFWDMASEIVSRVNSYLHDTITPYVSPYQKFTYSQKVFQFKRACREFQSKEATMIGVHGIHCNEFSNLLIGQFHHHFQTWCMLSGVTENSILMLQSTLYDCLTKNDTDAPINKSNIDSRRQLLEDRLRNERCLIILDDIGKDYQRLSPLVVLDKTKLGENSVVVVHSKYKHTLREEVKVDVLIDFIDEREKVALCYEEGDVDPSFVSLLEETLLMHGLDVLVYSSYKCTEIHPHTRVILIIFSKQLLHQYFQDGLENWKISTKNRLCDEKLIYISYGLRSSRKGSSSPFFSFHVNFEDPTHRLHEPQFRGLVEEVVQTFENGENTMDVPQFPVGLHERCNAIESDIENHLSIHRTSVKVFGIHGMRGMGKTTISKYVFNKMCHRFEGSAFISNTRESAAQGKSSLVKLQQDILKSVLTSRAYQHAPFTDEEHGKHVLSKNLKGTMAFIVLDDVADTAQVEALCKPLCTLGPKSVVLVNSDDLGILRECVQSKEDIFEIKELGVEDSQRLLYWHAFGRPEPPYNLKELSKQIIHDCGGCPLQLKVIGSHLQSCEDGDPQNLVGRFRLIQGNEPNMDVVMSIDVHNLEKE